MKENSAKYYNGDKIQAPGWCLGQNLPRLKTKVQNHRTELLPVMQISVTNILLQSVENHGATRELWIVFMARNSRHS